MQHRLFLVAAVFIGGVATLGIELSSSRLLQPFFGSSQLIWANVIGLTLISLTIGYRVGGRMADQRPNVQVLGLILVGAGLATALIPMLAGPILMWSASLFTSFSVGILVGSFFGVLFLFFLPIMLLGMVTPFAIRMSMRDLSTAGATAGSLYALSTVGSIVGTFLPVVVLIPTLGTYLTFYVFALLLVVLGSFGIRRRIALVAITAVLVLAIQHLGLDPIRDSFCWSCTSRYEQESRYNYMNTALRQPPAAVYLSN